MKAAFHLLVRPNFSGFDFNSRANGVASGLYVHDLTYNAQKPAQIASTNDSVPLINFQRYRTTATIVKGLLRLIDASSLYDFPPVEGVIERCLWMAALSDDRIRTMSKALE